MGTVNTLSPTDAAIIGGTAGAVIGTILMTSLILGIIYIIASWKILEKAGEPGWKALIPIYNVYIMFKIVNMKSWFWWLICINFCASIMLSIDGIYTMTQEQLANFNLLDHPTTFLAIIIAAVAEIWVGFTHAWRIAKVFGHGCGYTIGLIFLPNIFQLILGFGSSKYNKKRLNK